jgi:hypothetical protein
MIVHARDDAGAGIGPWIPALWHVSSYCPLAQSDEQLSVPPLTPPSGRTVAPLLTPQMF